MRSIKILLIFFTIISFSCKRNYTTDYPKLKDIETAINKGEFSKAKELIDIYLISDSITVDKREELLFEKERLDRIVLDFSQSDSSIREYIKSHFRGATDKQIDKWIEEDKLENLIINGERVFFSRAGRNLFRIDSLASSNFDLVKPGESDSLDRFLSKNLSSFLNNSKSVSFRITYSIVVKSNSVPDGEIIRAWIPYPRRDKESQTDIKLIKTSQQDFVISPDVYLHSSIYMEKRAVKDEPTIFQISYEYKSKSRSVPLDTINIPPYKTDSHFYKYYTKEKPPHILFSEKIKDAVEEAIGNETNPYLKVKKIFNWIDSKFPWAGAREYSTIPNIPEYVLNSGHGDCGQVSLLFITMARYAGIPAKWQSGWMMHPGNENLHDWAEYYLEGYGWIPLDQSFGRMMWSNIPKIKYFYTNSLDPYRLILNEEISSDFYPSKIHFRSESVDFQRGEVEWKRGNLYFDKWDYDMKIEYLD